MKLFDENYILRTVSQGFYQVFNRKTNEAASPRYSSRDAAIYYVEQELIQEMEENIDKMLGGSGDITRVYDDPSFRSGLPDAISRDGQEEE